MDKNELKEKLQALYTEHQQQRKMLFIEYAFKNNTVQEGDIVEDHIGKLKVEKIRVSVLGDESQCVYEGIELKKDGTPAKKQTGRTVWQCNLKK